MSRRSLGILAFIVATQTLSSSGCKGQLLLPETSAPDQPCRTFGCACEQSSDCDAQYECGAGRCQLAMCSPYRLDGACPAGRQCSKGVCITDAAAEQGPYCDCTPSQGCDDGVCYDITDLNGCSDSTPRGLCPEGSVCLGGACVVLGPDTACSVANPTGLCPQGTGCVGGVCIPVTDLPCGPSRLDGLCDTGLTCVPPGVCDIAPCGPTAPLGRCDPGQYCSSETHCLSIGACDSPADCSALYACDQGWCVRDTSCSSDDGCLPSEHCSTAGSCLPIGSCTVAADCAGGQICSTLGHCLAVGACETAADCPNGERCGTTRVCLADGECAAAADCPPGFDCDGQSCALGGQPCTANASTPTTCPAGETCCPDGERCSAGGSCIFYGQCVDDTDCLTPSFVCGASYLCEPTQPCDAGCATGEVCSVAGGCIPDGQCVADLDCPDGQMCNALFECVPTSDTCGSTTFGTTLVEPNMLIVLDKSGSMDWSFGTTTRWEAAKSAVASVLANNSDRIRFGLTTFPGTANACAPGGVSVPVGDGTAAAITSALDAIGPNGGTPTPATLRGIAASPGSFGLPDPSDPVKRGNYALLVTDGEANCISLKYSTTPDPTGANGAVDLLHQAGVTTYVVGIAFNTVSPDLNCNAVYGGTSRCGGAMMPATCTGTDPTTYTCTCSPSTYSATACYYEAGDAAALTAAFDEIARAVASCSFVLSTQPPDPSKLYVYLKDAVSGAETSVPADAADGWTYTSSTNQLKLNGSACAQITSGAATPLVKYGCVQQG